MAKNPAQLTYDYVQQRSQGLFFDLGTDGQIIEANTYAESVIGIPLARQKFQDLVVDFIGSFDLKILIQEPSKDHLLNIRMKSGLPQSYYFHFEPMENRVLAFGSLDNEELEKMRRDILSLNQDLNNLTRQLHKKNAQLKRLNKEKNQFLGMAAHDLRKPIGLILSYSEFLMDEAADVLNGEQKGFLNTINASCSFMKRLVDDFLDVSAIEAGKFELDLQSVDIQKILEQSLILNTFQAVKKKIELEVRIEENIPQVKMDAAKIEQVITNLVSNAIEHTNPDTKVTIDLSYDPQEIKVFVQDRGKGIAPEEMDRLFKPFEKTSTKKTGGEKSTGLGMVITRKIIETHGGKIWVDSEVGRGTIVTFTLPRKAKMK